MLDTYVTMYLAERMENMIYKSPMGRPLTGENPLDQQIITKFDEPTKKAIRKIAKRCNTSTSQIIRYAVKDYLEKVKGMK